MCVGHAQSLSCVWLCNLMDCRPPGSSVHGVFQARILEWVVISYFRGSSWPRDRTHVSSTGRQILLPLSHQRNHKEDTQMSSEHMKRCSRSLVTKYIQSKQQWDSTSHSLGWLVKNKNKETKDPPGGPVAKTSSFQCRRSRFNPWLGN